MEEMPPSLRSGADRFRYGIAGRFGSVRSFNAGGTLSGNLRPKATLGTIRFEGDPRLTAHNRVSGASLHESRVCSHIDLPIRTAASVHFTCRSERRVA
jgi:hypothetical protein